MENGGALRGRVLDATDPEAAPPFVDGHRVLAPGYALHSKAFMLTYNSMDLRPEDWEPFRAFTQSAARRLGARAWAACLERSSAEGRVHAHAYYFWTDGVGIQCANTDSFVFQRIRPRVDVCRKGARDALNRPAAHRGLYYVALFKRGTTHADTHFKPWDDFYPRAAWITNWWSQHKLTHAQYLELSAVFRTGHAARKAEAEAVMQDETEEEVRKRRAAAVALIAPRRRAFKPPPPGIEAWLLSFEEPDDRYKMLVLVGPSKVGKSAWAKDLCGPHRTLLVDCQHALHPDLRAFDVHHHGALVLDEIDGPDFVLRNKKVLQSHVDGSCLGQSATQKFAYDVFLWRVPIVLTCNKWQTDTLDDADQNWLQENCVVEHVAQQTWL